MKIGVIGAGAVGAASISTVIRGAARPDVIVIDRDEPKAIGLATDMATASAMYSGAHVTAGKYSDLTDADLVVITAGVNEKNGGAADRSDSQGRLALIPANARIYRDIVPLIVQHARDVPILVVTDPPDPLADLTAHLVGHQRVVSTGTVIDSLRFRSHLARALGVPASEVQASVLGEHGTSAVFAWSTARVGGVPVLELLARNGRPIEDIVSEVEPAVKFGNISVIEGIGASQHGIGAVVGRLVDVMLRDENAVLPVASYSNEFGVTLSLPSVLGRKGVAQTIRPTLTPEEDAALRRSAEILRGASALAIG